jgi:hypothetical protein
VFTDYNSDYETDSSISHPNRSVDEYVQEGDVLSSIQAILGESSSLCSITFNGLSFTKHRFFV